MTDPFVSTFFFISQGNLELFLPPYLLLSSEREYSTTPQGQFVRASSCPRKDRALILLHVCRQKSVELLSSEIENCFRGRFLGLGLCVLHFTSITSIYCFLIAARCTLLDCAANLQLAVPDQNFNLNPVCRTTVQQSKTHHAKLKVTRVE